MLVLLFDFYVCPKLNHSENCWQMMILLARDRIVLWRTILIVEAYYIFQLGISIFISEPLTFYLILTSSDPHIIVASCIILILSVHSCAKVYSDSLSFYIVFNIVNYLPLALYIIFQHLIVDSDRQCLLSLFSSRTLKELKLTMQFEYEDFMKADLWTLPHLTTINIEYRSYKRLKVHKSCWRLPVLTTLWSFLRI